MKITILVIFFVVLFVFCSHASDVKSKEYYSSVSNLAKLVSLESILLESLQEVIGRKYYIKNMIEGYIKELEKVTSQTQENPVDAFKLVYRCYHDLGQLEEQMLRMDHTEAYKNNVSELGIVVEERELIGASMALARLQKFYQFPTEDLARGILWGYTSPRMSGIDSFEIGRTFHDAGYLQRALEWLIQARLRLSIDHEYMHEWNVVSYLASCYYQLGNYKMVLKMCREILETDNSNSYALEMIEETRKQIETLQQLPLTKQVAPSSEDPASMDNLMFKKVCRGELTQTPREKRDLRCRYTSNNVPFCILAPFKMEEMSLDPYIRVFYDVIYDTEVSFIRNETEERMSRSQVSVDNGYEVSEVRTSQNTWLKLEEFQPLANLATRLDDTTGLNLEAAEEMQVANYGIAGHYLAHYDFFEGELGYYKTYLGNRITTALFYMGDVKLGGGTGFPLLRLLVPPTKGSLVVWHNLHESLELDYRTVHGGCPVIRGDKFIGTVWYHATYQEFRRPCLLYPNGNSSIAYKDAY